MATNPYEFHSVDIDDDTDPKKIKGTCFACGKEKHWIAFKDDHRYKCVKCDANGNLYTFMKWLITESLKSTSDSAYVALEAQRDIPISTLKRFKVCQSILSRDWLLPTLTQKGRRTTTVVNIHRAISTQKGFRLLGTPTCKQHLYNTHTVKSESKPIFVVEGQWDCMILDHMLRDAGMRHEYDVVAVPGANIFKPEHGKILAARQVILCYDNDDAGLKGIERVTKVARELNEQPTSIEHLVWPDDKDKGFDIRDLYQEMK